MWVMLLVAFYSGYNMGSAGAISHIDGFSTQQSCMQAAKIISDDQNRGWTRWDKFTVYCVEKK